MTAQQEFLPKEPLDLPAPDNESESRHPYEVKTLLSWNAPGRPFRKRGKEYYVSSLLIVLLIEIILFLFSQYLLMLVVLSLLFVAFALVTVPPHNTSYKISTEGLTVEDYFYLWQELYDFYFKKRDGIDILHVRTKAFFPGELTITLGDIEKDKVKSVLLLYLPYREVIRKTFMEKGGDWISKNFPLERTATVDHGEK